MEYIMVYDAMALDGVGNLHIKQWNAIDALYSYDLMETAPQPPLPIFSEINGLFLLENLQPRF